MKYCTRCGHLLHHRIPPGDNRPRYVCDHCQTIHYQNPRIVAGCLPLWQDRVLLCRRAIEPRRGLWTLPAGYMENGETLEQAAVRETFEEACTEVDEIELYTLFNLPHIDQVTLFFRARMRSAEFAAGDESLEVALFREDQIPWQALAFPTITQTLQFYFADRPGRQFPVRNLELAPMN